MSCPYFREGYFAVCIAYESMYTPSIARMETYCFNANYGLCPSLASYIPEQPGARNLMLSKEASPQRKDEAL